MKTIAGHIRVSDQQLEEIKRNHEQRDADDRAALAAQGIWTVIPKGVAVAALPECIPPEFNGDPVVAVGSWDGQVGLAKELEARAARINAHTVYLSKPHTRTIPMYNLDGEPLVENLEPAGEQEQTYCYAAFASDTPYTVSEVTREFAAA
jgi:hypothetical protein